MSNEQLNFEGKVSIPIELMLTVEEWEALQAIADLSKGGRVQYLNVARELATLTVLNTVHEFMNDVRLGVYLGKKVYASAKTKMYLQQNCMITSPSSDR